MILTITIHLWFTRLVGALDSWSDFGGDLADLSISDEEVMVDLNAGREQPQVPHGT